MKTVDILYSEYYDSKGEKMTIGGIQTYITNLVSLILKIGYNVRVFQYADIDFCKEQGNTKIYGIKTDFNDKKKHEKLFETAQNIKTDGEKITIIATDTMIPGKNVKNSIAIQHGICWDIPYTYKRNFIRHFIGKSLVSCKIIKNVSHVDKLVCVDYNFVNWYRAMICTGRVKCKVIPNFAQIAPEKEKASNNINIIFARRFSEYRGTKIFGGAISRILKEYDNINVTLAGDGADKQWLIDKLGGYENITFTSYSSEESIEIHQKHDIAVVPTVGSEGTSLSLLEAMSAGCAVICSNVGGLTNIVLDGHNGLMIEPDEESLYKALKKLIEDSALRKKLSKNGYQTVVDSFSYEKWKEKWTEIIKSM